MGARMGIVSIEWLVKYDAYKIYKDFLEQGYVESEAKVLASDKCKCDPSTIARYIYSFERDDPFYHANKTLSIIKSGRRWKSFFANP